MRGLSYSERITTLKELLLLAGSLEPDAGIRIKRSENNYLFLGRMQNDFVIVEASNKKGKLIVERTTHLKDKKELEEFFAKNVREPLDAVLY